MGAILLCLLLQVPKIETFQQGGGWRVNILDNCLEGKTEFSVSGSLAANVPSHEQMELLVGAKFKKVESRWIATGRLCPACEAEFILERREKSFFVLIIKHKDRLWGRLILCGILELRYSENQAPLRIRLEAQITESGRYILPRIIGRSIDYLPIQEGRILISFEYRTREDSPLELTISNYADDASIKFPKTVVLDEKIPASATWKRYINIIRFDHGADRFFTSFGGDFEIRKLRIERKNG